MQLVAERAFGGGSFAEIGRPGGVFDSDTGLVALTGAFDSLYWPGRATYHRHALRYRLSLYDERARTRVGVRDDARFPINAIAFHPTEPVIAIGAGRYDGGYQYEGELLLWNHRTGDVRSLLGESREVDGCRFLHDGRLSLLLRPRDDQEFATNDDDDDLFVTCVVDPSQPAQRDANGDPRLAGLRPVDPRASGFDLARPPRQLAELATSWSATFEERHRVWDIAWVDDDSIVLVLDGCLAERWSAGGQRLARYEASEQGVQVFAGQPLLVHAMHRRANSPYGWGASSLWTLGPDSPRELQRWTEAKSLSRAADGSMLARDTGHGKSNAVVLDGDGAARRSIDLGGYDCVNHYLRVDGWPRHLYLAGNESQCWRAKRLMALSPDGERQDELWPWDGPDVHRMESVACLAPNDRLIAGYLRHHPHPGKGQAFIESRLLAGGGTQWSLPVEAGVTAMVAMPGRSCVVVALLSGRVAAHDLDTGALLWEERASIDGLPTIVTALAARDDRLAAGTICGRVILFRCV